MNDALLEVENFSGAFRGETGELAPVLHGVSYRLETGLMTAVVGESGSGKSLTALSILGIQPPAFERTGGRILFRGTDLCSLDERAMRGVRGAQISMVFQDARAALNPVFTVGRQLADVWQLQHGGGRKTAMVQAVGAGIVTVILVLSFVGIPDYLRLARAEIQAKRNWQYAEAARLAGNLPWRVAFRHLLPNSVGPILAFTSINAAFAALVTASLGFLGLGLGPNVPEWGNMIAMAALICEPSLLILDEPTTGLDVTIQSDIMELIVELSRTRGLTTCLITHDLGVVVETCQNVVVMNAGRVVECGSAEAIFTRPRDGYTQRLLASSQLVEAA